MERNVLERLLVAILIVSWVPWANAATGCVVLGDSAARVQTHGQEKAPPLRLAQCEGAKVTAGSVSVCFLNNTGERTCQQLQRDETFDPAAAGAKLGAGTGAFRATLVSLFKGDAQARIGQTRTDPPYPGFPYKVVLLPERDLVIPLQTAKTRKVEMLILNSIDNTREPLTFPAINGRLVIPSSLLVRGKEYSWEARGEEIAFLGKFKLATDAEVAQISKTVAQIQSNTSLNALSRRVLIAEVYFENGYAFDANSLMTELAEDMLLN